MFDYIFPKINELSVFVITVLLYATIIISPELHELLGGLWQELRQHWQTLWSMADTFYQKLEFIGGLFLMLVFFSIISLAPLFLPFTQRDIRGFCISILWLDAGLIIYWNSQTGSGYSWVQTAFILYWAAWFLYSYFVVRIGGADGPERLINDEQTAPITALMISGIGFLFLLIFKLLLGWWWLDSYMAAVLVALFAERFCDKFFYKTRDTESIP